MYWGINNKQFKALCRENAVDWDVYRIIISVNNCWVQQSGGARQTSQRRVIDSGVMRPWSDQCTCLCGQQQQGPAVWCLLTSGHRSMEFSHWQWEAMFFPQHCTKGIVALYMRLVSTNTDSRLTHATPRRWTPIYLHLIIHRLIMLRNIDVWSLHTCFSVSHVSITTRVVSSSSTVRVFSYISSIETCKTAF